MKTSVADIENHRKNLVDQVERREMVLRLRANPDFQKLILSQFCEKETAALVGAATDIRIPASERECAMENAKAGPTLTRWLQLTVDMAQSAQDNIEEVDALLIAARRDEARGLTDDSADEE